MKTEEFQTTKLWKVTIRKLRMIAALTGSSMVKVADRLANEELQRLDKKEDKKN